jgi:hypothetical protein
MEIASREQRRTFTIGNQADKFFVVRVRQLQMSVLLGMK